MKLLRSSLRRAASPGSPAMSSTGAPMVPNSSAARAAPSPLTTNGVCAPCVGTEPTTETSANWAPDSLVITVAICFFNAADPAFRSANNAVVGRWGATAVAARNAALPPVRLRTRSAPRTASATSW